jgi:multimeric flavodoxin WrbA
VHENKSDRGEQQFMKVLGISFGRKMKNCEILVKEALMEAEKAGADVSFIRMIDLNIQPCCGCGGCGRSLSKGGSGNCIIRDDLPFVDKQMMAADAIIVAAPVYVLGPTGQLKQVADRIGPSHDLAFLTKENEKRIAEGKTGDRLVAPENFKQRVAGLISVGGASTQNWVSFGLPTMHLLCFPSQIRVVDQIDAYDMGRKGSPLLDKELMVRVGKLGRNVVSAIGKPTEEVKWMGDEEGTCPVCHCNLLTIQGKTTVECPVCGIYGKLTVEGDNIKVTFSEAEQKRSRLNFDGKLEHWTEITSMGAVAGPKIAAAGEELPEMLKKYEGYKD